MKTANQVLRSLQTGGLLLLHDKAFPSVASLVTDETLSASWWSHPRATDVFRVVSEIVKHPDVLLCKLVDGKVTFVHKELWPAVLAIGLAREPWQTRGLSKRASALLDQVEREGSVVTAGTAVKEIEKRLLAHGEQFHTESGNHKIRLESWLNWSRQHNCEPAPSVDEALSQIELAVTNLGGSPKTLPWQRLQPTR